MNDTATLAFRPAAQAAEHFDVLIVGAGISGVGGAYHLTLQFYQDNRPILATEAQLAPGSPLFIRGPQHGAGQVIIELQVQR